MKKATFLIVLLAALLYFSIHYEAVELSEVPAPENYSFDYPMAGVYFDGVKTVPYSAHNFIPPIMIKSEITKHSPYHTIFRFFDREGELMGNYTQKAGFSAGYFYFKDGFIIYTMSTDGFDVNAFTYDLKHRYWVMVHPIYLNYHVIIPRASFADEKYAYFFTANKDDIKMKIANYCLTYIEFESGDTKRVCNSKVLNEQPAGARVFRDRIYVATAKVLYLLEKSGKVKRNRSTNLPVGVLMQANKDYLTIAYNSTVCVFTSNLKAHRCLIVGGKIDALKLEGDYLYLKTKNRILKFKITLKRLLNLG